MVRGMWVTSILLSLFLCICQIFYYGHYHYNKKKKKRKKNKKKSKSMLESPGLGSLGCGGGGGWGLGTDGFRKFLQFPGLQPEPNQVWGEGGGGVGGRDGCPPGLATECQRGLKGRLQASLR